ncbi:nucleotide pyrophosphohydrolase [Massilia horti]|uniref:Nucleotide pyrophosphohydrolase n=1 Tax=Massilia horti TaxID=2562153 RepID=A0A4Y9SNQ6_9BURK|nr:nucleotide pyrophosphohydrolase [Massilia horti]TFV86091.1 nucleotide pyrophosphohydrolase [Oxalobacteraceae bacterium OM1]TFW28121.1 nucleotide pyrophosphohydrolase [Massilia horti]TFW28124.1 nucleotide pyrophosphohydrolase [Massilia horti]
MNGDGQGELARLRDLVREFVDERDWDQFHTPKNLAAALSVEAAELLEHFQWLQNGRRDELGEDKLRQVRHEIADVMVYLVRIADKLDIDLMSAVEEKMVINRAKYPAALVRGDARKYSEYKHADQRAAD